MLQFLLKGNNLPGLPDAPGSMSFEPESMNLDCGGDCLSCMAWHGDPDAIEAVERLTGEKVNVRGRL